MKNTTVTLPKEEYDKLIDIKENFEQKVEKEIKDYASYVESEKIFLKANGVFKAVSGDSVQFYSLYNEKGYELKDIYVTKDTYVNFKELLHNKLEKSYCKLKNHWLVKLFGL